MKKSKLLRKVAYPAAPQHADGFVPPANYSHKIIVNLQNVDIKVYGFTGTQWEMIHNADGVVDNFIGNVLHQKYYFESKTGVEQTIRVSFLSSEEEPELDLEFGATHETRRFHHIEEIPAYYGSDEGAMLTVMSDGSLRWLGANESYIVENNEQGNNGGGQSSQAYGSNGLEEGVSTTAEIGSSFRLNRNAVVDSDGFLYLDGAGLSVQSEYSTHGLVPTSAEHYYADGSDIANFGPKVNGTQQAGAVSVWFKAETLKQSGAANGQLAVLVSNHIKPGPEGYTGWSNTKPYGTPLMNNGFFISVGEGRIYAKCPRTGANMAYNTTLATNQWYKIDMVWRSNGSTLGTGEAYNELYLNGQLVKTHGDTRNIQKGSDLRIGWGFSTVSFDPQPFNGWVDAVEVHGDSLTAQEIQDNYNAEVGNY